MKALKLAVAILVLGVQGAMAFPSWMGVYGGTLRHSGENPGAFTVMMNQDYYGLHAQVGIQVNGGAWSTHEMFYVGNKDGNSVYEFMPEQSIPEGAAVKYFFRGYEEYSTRQIFDNNNGLNHAFTAASLYPDQIRLLSISSGTGLGCYSLCGRLDLDVKVKNLGYRKSVGMLYTLDNQTWKVLPLQYLGPLENGYEKWGYHNNFSMRDFALRFAVYYTDVEKGVTYWDNNGGRDYVHPKAPNAPMVQLASHGKVPYFIGGNGITATYDVGFFMDIYTHDFGVNTPVGIVWSDNDWTTHHDARARYVTKLDNGLLKWRIELTGGRATIHREGFLTSWLSPDGSVYGHGYTNPDRFIRYAVYFTENGRTYWDNNGGDDFAQSVKP